MYKYLGIICIWTQLSQCEWDYIILYVKYLLYNYNNVSVCPFVRRRFRVLIDAAEPARTVGQFRILMDRRNWAGQIVRLGRWNSQGEETDRSFGLADGILKAKRRTDRSAWQTEFSRRKEEAQGGGPARGGDRRGWGQHGWGRIGGGGVPARAGE